MTRGGIVSRMEHSTSLEALSDSLVLPVDPAALLSLVNRVVREVIQPFANSHRPCWASARLFGSCGLGAATIHSDIDLYDESSGLSPLLSSLSLRSTSHVTHLLLRSHP